MALSTFANATDLHRWAGTKHAQGMLPILIRRLLRATTPSLERAGYPGGDSVARPGWDGIVVAAEATSFVSAGQSAWELGADANPRGKAEDDYIKRTKNPGSVIPAETTYYAVTLRRWQKKGEWEEEKTHAGAWKAVRVYDADDLEEWLEAAPVVHFWLSHLLGKHPSGAEDLERFWSAYAAATEPPLSPQLLIAGRDEVVAGVLEVARGSRETQAVGGETRGEALGIIVASLVALPEDEWRGDPRADAHRP